MNNTTRTIRSEEITIDMRVLTIMEDGRKNGEIHLAAIAPDMELTVITLDEAPDIQHGGKRHPGGLCPPETVN